MKYAWIAGQGQAYTLSEMCGVLDVSISGYRAWKRGGRPDRKRLTDGQPKTLDEIGKVPLVMRWARDVDERCGERDDIDGEV